MPRRGILFFLREKNLGQGFEAFFFGRRGPGAALRPERKVNILQDRKGFRTLDFILQLFG